jgi:hypothetical protein
VAAQFAIETRISPQSELPFVELASLNLRRHAAKDAIAPAKRAVQLAPTAAAAHYVLGRGYLDWSKLMRQFRNCCAPRNCRRAVLKFIFIWRGRTRKSLPEKAAAERAVLARRGPSSSVALRVRSGMARFVRQMEFSWPFRILSEHLQAVLRRNEFSLTK